MSIDLKTLALYSLLAYGTSTCLSIVDNKDAALLVDLTLCADTWILEALQGCVMVTGYLERCNVGQISRHSQLSTSPDHVAESHP